MLFKYPWILSTSIQKNYEEILAFLFAEKVCKISCIIAWLARTSMVQLCTIFELLRTTYILFIFSWVHSIFIKGLTTSQWVLELYWSKLLIVPRSSLLCLSPFYIQTHLLLSVFLPFYLHYTSQRRWFLTLTSSKIVENRENKYFLTSFLKLSSCKLSSYNLFFGFHFMGMYDISLQMIPFMMFPDTKVSNNET